MSDVITVGLDLAKNVFQVNRPRFPGHLVGLRGHGHGRKVALSAQGVWTEVAVLLDQPLGAVAGDEGAHGVADLVEGLEDAAVDDLLFEGSEEALDDAVGLGLADEGAARGSCPTPSPGPGSPRP